MKHLPAVPSAATPPPGKTSAIDLQVSTENSTKEELQVLTEELQAANEELETSWEELRSQNEEIAAGNEQLNRKVEELNTANNDLNNFLVSTNIPTLFLDQRFCVKRFTPAMERLIQLIPGDIGRPISDFSQEYFGPDLVADCQAVQENLIPVKREVPVGDSWYIRSTLPYRTADNRIDGVVITYSDVTVLKRVEERLRFHTENAPLAIIEWDADFIVSRWAGEAERMFGWSAAQTVGKPIMGLNMIYEEDLPLVEKTIEKLTDGVSRHVVSSNRNYTKDRRVIHCTWYNSVLYDAAGKMSSVLSQVLDTTEQMLAEEEVRQRVEDLRESNEELVRFNRAMEGRELRMIELKKEVNALCGQTGQPPRYPLDFEKEEV